MADQESFSVAGKKPKQSPAQKKLTKSNPKGNIPLTRQVSQGDISPSLTESGIEQFVVGQAIAAAQEYCQHALQTSYAIAEGQRIPNRVPLFATSGVQA